MTTTIYEVNTSSVRWDASSLGLSAWGAVDNRQQKSLNPWVFVQQCRSSIEIEEETARRIVELIPDQCPFAREMRVFSRVSGRVSSLCKLNLL